MTTQDPPMPGPPEPERPEEGRPVGMGGPGPGTGSGGSGPPPPPPPYNGDGPLYDQRPRNGLGTAGLVCGIIAVALSLVPGLNVFTWPLGVLAIVFGAVGWSRANRAQATNKNAAITGLVLGIVSFFTFCLIYVLIGASGGVYYD